MSAALLLQNLAASALLMLLVLLVRGRIAALFGARLAYALWALPLIRLVMPPLPEIARPVAAHVPIRIDLSGLEGIAAALPAGAEAASPAMIAPHAAGMAAATGPDWAALMVPGLILLWLGGAALHFAWHIGLYRHFLKMALRGSAFLCRRCGIAVHVSAGVDGPVAAGIVRRRILLPGDFTRRYTRQEQRLVLAHEVAHHVRGDLIANIFALAMLSLHWFNPLAHIAYRAFRADQELACDETVLADEPATERHAYATALVKSATRGTPAAACALGAARIKRRLQMMATGKIGRARRLGGAALVGLMVGGGLLATASGGVAAATGIDMPRLAVAAPLAPLAPAAPAALAAPAQPAIQAVPLPPSVVAPDAPEPPAPVAAPAAPRPPVEAQTARERAARAREHAAMLREQADRMREQAAEAREAAAEARAIGREARREAMRAQARADVIRVDVDREVHVALAQARAELARTCGNGRGRISAEADDRRAIATLAASCVDARAIRAQVADALKEARAEIRAADLTASQRASVLASLDQQIAALRADSVD